MANDVSISVSLTDKYSSKISAMSEASSQYESQLSSMAKTVSTLESQQSSYITQIAKQKTAIVDARKEVTEATAEYKKLGTEISQTRMESAIADYSLMTQELKDLQKQSTNTGNSIRSLATDAESLARTEYSNSLGISSGSSTSSSAVASTFSSVWAAGAADAVSDAVVEATTAGVTSAFGGNAGTVVSSALTGAISGAAIGTMAGGLGLGTAVGAGVGAVTGTVSGAMSVFSEQDDYFKEYVQSAVETAQSNQSDIITSGSTTAASRETDLISFTTLLGDVTTATGYLDELKTMANSTPFLYDDLTGISKTLLAYGTELEDILPTVSSVGDAGAALGLGTDDISTLATALGRMNSTDKSSLEYMNLLTERGISAIDWVAERDSISVAEVYDNISAGTYSGKEMAEFLASKMDELYGGSMEAQSLTTSGLQSTLEGWNTEIEAAAGEGYNTVRNEGVAEQISWLSGESGEAMQEAYSAIGAFEADLENQKEALEREYIDAAMNSAEYAAAQAAGDAAEMGSILMAAQVDAANAYNASEGAQLMLEAELALIGTVQASTAVDDAYWDAGYQRGQEYTKGILAGLSAGSTSDNPSSIITDWDASQAELFADWYPHADGLATVPYDNYPALLHEGEQVLTAREVRANERNQGSTVTVTGNTFTVRTDADITAIAKELLRQANLQQMAGVY